MSKSVGRMVAGAVLMLCRQELHGQHGDRNPIVNWGVEVPDNTVCAVEHILDIVSSIAGFTVSATIGCYRGTA